MAQSDRRRIRLQGVIISILLTLPLSLTVADEHKVVKDLGSKMQVFEGAWDNETPPPPEHDGWAPTNHDVFTSKPREESIWISGKLEATGSANPHWLLLSPLASRAQVFINGTPTSEDSKFHLDNPLQKAIPFHHLVFPLPNTASTSDLSIKFDPEVPISTPVKLVNQAGLISEVVLHTGLSASLASIILVLSIYNLFLFFNVKDPIYLIYVGIATCVFLYTLSLTNLLPYFGITEASFNRLVNVVLILTPMLSIQFVIRVLDVKEISTKIYSLYQALSLLLLCLLPMTPFLSAQSVAFVSAFLVMMVYLSFIPIAVIRAANRYKPALYFLIGWLPLVAALTATALQSLSIVRGGQWVAYYIPAAMSWEMVLFSLALASRIKILRDERDTLQAQQIEVSEKARKALERSNQIKDDFLNAVSHELRTPLHTIQGQLDLLREAPLNGEQNQAFRLIEYANLRMTRQVGGILDFVDAQEENLISSPQVFEPQSLFDLLEYEFREAARAKPVSLFFDIDDSVPRKILMDGLMLEKVLYQLIDNAVKFSPGGGQVMVRGMKVDQDSTLRFVVSDTGPGIPEDQRSQVFQAFRQGETGLTRRYGGVGLGLPLATSLVNALGGLIEVSESSQNGTVIDVQVPFGEIYLPPIDENHYSDSHSISSVSSASRVPRILVAEDDAGNRMIIRKQLEKMGVVSEGVQNGVQAVEAAMKEHWDMIIMDCQMPVMDGIEATREIRLKAAANLETPIIAVTANASESYRRQCLEAGMDDYCTKPLPMDKLRNLVLRYAEPRKAERVRETQGIKA